MAKKSIFSEKVIRVVQSVPYGQVVSYGQVAAYLGSPRAARQVGWTLMRLEVDLLPWWRVINNQGRISIKGNKYVDAITQRRLLRQEQITVGEDFSINIEKYRFKANKALLKSWGLDDFYVQSLLS